MSYNLKQCKYKNGKIFLEIVDSVYVKSKGYSIPVVIEKLGYLDDLKQIYVDPISFFKNKAKQMEAERKQTNNFIPRQSQELNLGSFLPLHVLNLLKLDDLSRAIDYSSKRQYSHYDVLEFLTLSRIIYPASRIDTYANQLSHFYKNYSFSKDQMYDGLQLIGENDQAYLEYLNTRIAKLYKRNLEHVYFDCTNYYFEIDADSYDEYRKPGPSKENHQGAIISMGLLLDADAIPLYYKLFPGNQSEKPVLNDVISSMKENCDVRGKTIRVADKGLNCTENIINAHISGDGYIYSKAIRSQDDQAMILHPEGYEEMKDEYGNVIFKCKTWIDSYEYDFNGRTYKLKEKRMVIWSRKYAEKARYEREKAMRKVETSSSTSSLKQSLTSKAIDTLYDVISDDDGCILNAHDISLVLNESKLSKKEELDGYYMIVTSETYLSWKDVLDTYRKLWEIEASFRLTKSQFQARPIFASTEYGIRGHFFICYLALTLTRLIQKKELDNQFNAEKIIDFIRTLKAFPVSNEQFLLSGSYQDIIQGIEKRYGLKFNAKTISLDKLLRLFSF